MYDEFVIAHFWVSYHFLAAYCLQSDLRCNLILLFGGSLQLLFNCIESI